MNIPKKIKIGAKTYNIEITDKLVLGCNFDGEVTYSDLTIRIRPDLAKKKEEAVFLHEVMHTILDHLGYIEHDEKKVDELANALHMIITDNPNIFLNK